MAFRGSTSAHKPGYTCLCLSGTGEHVLTGGKDGKVKVWKTLSDTEPLEFSVGKVVNSILCKNESFVAANDSITVRFYRLMDGSPEPGGVALKFTTDVTHLSLNKLGNKLAAAANDFMVKVVNLLDPQETPHGLQEEQHPLYFSTPRKFPHQGAVLSVALDPEGNWLATSSCDGWLRLWELQQEAVVTSPTMAKCLKLLQMFPKAVGDAQSLPCLYRMVWEPETGNLLALCDNSRVLLFDRQSGWSVRPFSPQFPNDASSKSFTDCIFSPDGQFLVAATADGWICCWHIQREILVRKYRNPNGASICALLWSRTSPWELLFTDMTGVLSAVHLPLEELLEDAATSREAEKEEATNDDLTEADLMALQEIFMQEEKERNEKEKEKKTTENDDLTEADLMAMQEIFMQEEKELNEKEEEKKKMMEEDEATALLLASVEMEKSFKPTETDQKSHSPSAPTSPYAASEPLDRAFIGEDQSVHIDDDDDDEDGTVIDLSKIKAAYMDQLEDEERQEVNTAGEGEQNVLASLGLEGKKPADSALTSQLSLIGSKHGLAAPQQSFQPGSTPFLSQSERFMLWNRTAVIREFSADADVDGQSNGSLEIEFHDSSLHPAIRLTNESEYEMADLTTHGLVLGSQASRDLDEENGDDTTSRKARLYFRSWTPSDGEGLRVAAADREDELELPPGERVLAVGLCGGASPPPDEDEDDEATPLFPGNLLAVVACSVPRQTRVTGDNALFAMSQEDKAEAAAATACYLRVFSVSAGGLQFCAPILVAPPCPESEGLVAICGSRCHLMLVRHAAGLPRGRLQNLEWSVTPVDRLLMEGSFTAGSWQDAIIAGVPEEVSGGLHQELFQWKSLPLAGAASLAWIGFSEEGTPYMADSQGLLLGYLHGAWRPMLDLRTELKNASDHFFVVGVHEAQGLVGAVYCKASRYPRPMTRPVMRMLQFKMPMLTLPGERGQLEEEYVRLKLLFQHLRNPWDPSVRINTQEMSKKLRANLLKLFALAVLSEDEARALEVAHLMPDSATVQLAICYVGRMNKRVLAEKLSRIARTKVYRQRQPEVVPSAVKRISSSPSAKVSAQTIPRLQREANLRDIQDDEDEEEEESPRRSAPARHQPVKKLTKKIPEEEEDEDDEEVTVNESNALSKSFSTTLATRSPAMAANPFRVAGRGASSSLSVTKPATNTPKQAPVPRKSGTLVFDDLSRSKKPTNSPATSSLEKVSSKPVAKQATLFGSKPAAVDSGPKKSVLKPNNSGFKDWFEEHREELEEEFPELSVEELQRKAKLQYAQETGSTATKATKRTSKDQAGAGNENGEEMVKAKRGRPSKASENVAAKLSKFAVQ